MARAGQAKRLCGFDSEQLGESARAGRYGEMHFLKVAEELEKRPKELRRLANLIVYEVLPSHMLKSAGGSDASTLHVCQLLEEREGPIGDAVRALESNDTESEEVTPCHE